MAQWLHFDVLDNGPAHVKANATKILLLGTYAKGDSYATVVANSVGSADVVSGDFTLSTATSDRQLSCASKTGAATADSVASPDLHIAFTNGVDKVLWVTDETTNQRIYNGNPIIFPVVALVSAQL